MVRKFMSISQVSSANDDFVEAYEKQSIGGDHHAGLSDLPPNMPVAVLRSLISIASPSAS